MVRRKRPAHDPSYLHQNVVVLLENQPGLDRSAEAFMVMVDEILDRYGSEGWQLVGAVPLTEAGTTYAVQYLFRATET